MARLIHAWLNTFTLSRGLAAATLFAFAFVWTERASAQTNANEPITINFTSVIPTGDNGSQGDMFVKVFVNGTKIAERELRAECNCTPLIACGCGTWRGVVGDQSVTFDPDDFAKPITMQLELWDHDGGLNGDPDEFNWTRDAPGKHLQMRLDLDAGIWIPIPERPLPHFFGPFATDPMRGCDSLDGGLCWHFSNFPPTDGDCDGVDDDNDGMKDEGCLLRFWFAPVCYNGTDAQFQTLVDTSVADIARVLGLSQCSARIAKTVVLPSTIRAANGGQMFCPPCTEQTLGSFSDAIATFYTGDGEPRFMRQNYTAGHLFADQDICGRPAGSTLGIRPDERMSRRPGDPPIPAKLTWGESRNRDIFPHELGHLAGLSEEYCHRAESDAFGPLPGHPDHGGSNNCNTLGSINALTAQYGCDPFQSSADPTACCSHAFRENGNPANASPDDRACTPPVGFPYSGACCQGNLARALDGGNSPIGERCAMSASSTTQARNYCQACYSHWKGTNQGLRTPVDCSTVNIPGAVPIINFSYTLGESGAVQVHQAGYHEGTGRLGFHDPGRAGKFTVILSAASGATIYQASRNLDDGYFDVAPPSPLRSASFSVEARLSPADIGSKMKFTTFEGFTPRWRTTLNGSPPVTNAGPDRTLQCNSTGISRTILTTTASDPDGDTIANTWSSSTVDIVDLIVRKVALVPGGRHTVTVETTDGLYTATDSVDFTVADTEPPVVSPTPNHINYEVCTQSPRNVTAGPFAIPTAQVTDLCTPGLAGRVRLGIVNEFFVPLRASVLAGPTFSAPVGVGTFFWDATDPAGNTSAVVEQTYSVRSAVAALNSISLRDNANLGNTTVTNYGTGPVSLNPGARVGDIITVGTVVTVAAGATTGTVRKNAVLGGNLAHPPEFNFTSPPNTHGDIMLEPGQTRTLNALGPNESYGIVTVKSGARLVLTAGTHRFQALRLEPDSSVLELAGEVVINIASEFLYSGQPIVNQTARNPVVNYLGTAPVFLQRAFSGRLTAPTAKVTIRDPFTGSIIARDLEVDASEVLTCAL